MSQLNFHYEQKKTKLQLDIEEYGKKIKMYTKEKLEKELEKLNKKLVVPYIAFVDCETVSKDISNDCQEKNRLYMRKLTSETAKWIGYAIQQTTQQDFSNTWKLLNATFVSKTVQPDYYNFKLDVYEGASFMDTLSLEGLKMYKKFMVSVANYVLYDKLDFESSVKKAKQLVIALNDKMTDDHYYSDKILPNNWQIYYKYVMQQKECLNCIKELNDLYGFEI